jgi:hypothetical protein
MDQSNYQLASVVLQSLLLLVNVGVGGVIWWYTKETKLLRVEAQKGNETPITPLVILEGATDLSVSEPVSVPMPTHAIVIRNLGAGAAFNIAIDPLSGPDTQIQFETHDGFSSGEQGGPDESLRSGGRKSGVGYNHRHPCTR